MDITLFIAIIVAIIAIYLFIKFIVSPILRIVFGIIIFLVLIYILQRFLGFNLNHILAPFGISFSPDWESIFGWLLKPINYFTDQIKSFLTFIWHNIPKPFKI